MQRLALSTLLVLGCVLGGRTGEADESAPANPPSADAPKASSAYRVVALDPKAVGVVEGRCVVDADVAVETEDASRCRGGPRASDRVVVGRDRGLANCVVSLAGIGEGRDWPESMRTEDRISRFTLEGDQARFRQRVAWTRIGTQLVIENRTSVDMSAHGSIGSETVFNFAVGPGKASGDVVDAFLSRAGTYGIRDDCCPGIEAAVWVSAHPYVVVTGDSDATDRHAGSWRLDEVPPGTYDVVCWHEPLRRPSPKARDASMSEIRLVRTVRVEAGKRTSVDFTIPVPQTVRAPVAPPK